MKAIEPEVARAAAMARLSADTIEALPFPLLGNQKRYVDELVALLQRIRG
jgi:hypothetical protein